MLKNWLLITSVPFVIGFGASMLLKNSPGQSAFAGSAGVLGVASSMALSRKQRKQELERQLQSIQVTVSTLEQQEKSLAKQLQSHQDNRQTVQYQIEQLEQQLANLQSKQQGQEASVAKFDRELETKRISAIELDAIAQATRAELATITAEISALQQQQAMTQTSILSLQDIEAKIVTYSATKAQLTLDVVKLEDYHSEIKTQIADDKDICEKVEEYLQCIDQEVADKQEDLLELDINIKAKSTELNQYINQLNALDQQRIEAESALTQLAIELQKAGQAILDQEDIQHTAELEATQLSSDIASLKLELLECHTQMTEPDLQFVEFQPAAVSLEPPLSVNIIDLEETSPISANCFTDLCEMELYEIGLDVADLSDMTLEPVSLDIADLDDMTSEPVSLDIADLDDMTSEPVSLDIADLDDMTSEPVSLDIADLDDVTSEPVSLDIADLDDMTLDQIDLNGMTLEQIGLDGVDFNNLTLDYLSLDDMALVQSNLADDLSLGAIDWTESFAGNPHLQILQYIDQHGSIAHFEITALLNDKKSAKLFSDKVLEYALILPFEIEVEASKNGNTYVKKTDILATIS